MDVKQDPHESFKTKLGSGETNYSRFKNEDGDKSVIFVSQTTGQVVDVDIKDEIKCEMTKIELRVGVPIKIDYETVEIKKELENTNDFCEVKTTNTLVDISDIKLEVEHVQVKSELLTTNFDLPTLKVESTDYADPLSQPCSSKQVKRPLRTLKNRNFKDVRKKRRLYPCPVCQKNVLSSKSRSKHIDRHFRKSSVVCKFCGKFMNRIDFFQHYIIHLVKHRTLIVSDTGSNDLKSLFGSCIQSQPLKCDLSSLNKICMLKCEICSKEFKRINDLHRHLIAHTDERPFQCEFCCKKFKRACTLRQHLSNHSNGKPLWCNICSKKFIQICELKTHLKIHTNEKPFKCDICYKQFIYMGSLRSHSIKHIIENQNIEKKAYKCDTCSKRFKYITNLKIHLKIHLSKETFVTFTNCNICGDSINNDKSELNNFGCTEKHCASLIKKYRKSDTWKVY